MKHFHWGPMFRCARLRVHCELRGPFIGPWLSIEVLGIGYYAGWADDEFWEEQRAKGNVGPDQPWWKVWSNEWFKRHKKED